MKNMVITYEFFEKLIEEKSNGDDFKIKYSCNSRGNVDMVEFLSNDYYVMLLQLAGAVALTEWKLKDDKYEIVNNEIFYDACFHKDTLKDLEGTLKKLSKKYECLNKKADCSIEGITETYSFVK